MICKDAFCTLCLIVLYLLLSYVAKIFWTEDQFHHWIFDSSSHEYSIFRVIFIFLILIDSTLEERQKNKKGRRRAQKQKQQRKQKQSRSPNRQNKLRRLIQNDQPRRPLDRDRRAPYPRKEATPLLVTRWGQSECPWIVSTQKDHLDIVQGPYNFAKVKHIQQSN